MSMDVAPCSGYTIEHRSLLKVCPKEIEALSSYMSSKDIEDSVDVFKALIMAVNYGDDYEDLDMEEVTPYVTAIIDKFEKETGLILDVVHNEEPGCYDELEGYAYIIEKATCFTPEANRFIDKYGPIEFKRWTHWG